ncbi:MAG: dehydrogenase [Acidimicrobiaceae bacterium]|nr:dehydrogenase [Acidimicrobiaceae bacterium]
MRVLVTGGAQGIGRAVCEKLKDLGNEVISADRQEQKDGIYLDVTSEDSWEDALNSVGPLDGLVNCAGIRTRNLIVDTTYEEFQRHLDVNITGTWLGIRGMFRHRINKQASDGSTAASIVNIASVNAVIAVPAQAHYVASKGAIVGLTKAAAIEGAPLGVRVNAIAPGAIRTPMTEERLVDPEQVAWLEGRIPVGRVGEAHEMASVASFLLSNEASYVTGTTVFADGGWTANGV